MHDRRLSGLTPSDGRSVCRRIQLARRTGDARSDSPTMIAVIFGRRISCKPRSKTWACPTGDGSRSLRKMLVIVTGTDPHPRADTGAGMLIQHGSQIRVIENTRIGVDCGLSQVCSIIGPRFRSSGSRAILAADPRRFVPRSAPRLQCTRPGCTASTGLRNGSSVPSTVRTRPIPV